MVQRQKIIYNYCKPTNNRNHLICCHFLTLYTYSQKPIESSHIIPFIKNRFQNILPVQWTGQCPLSTYKQDIREQLY